MKNFCYITANFKKEIFLKIPGLKLKGNWKNVQKKKFRRNGSIFFHFSKIIAQKKF
jgi:hypothetical protein